MKPELCRNTPSQNGREQHSGNGLSSGEPRKNIRFIIRQRALRGGFWTKSKKKNGQYAGAIPGEVIWKGRIFILLSWQEQPEQLLDLEMELVTEPVTTDDKRIWEIERQDAVEAFAQIEYCMPPWCLPILDLSMLKFIRYTEKSDWKLLWNQWIF